MQDACTASKAPARRLLLFLSARRGGASPHPEKNMKYGIAWLIGVPPVIIGAWFLLNHC